MDVTRALLRAAARRPRALPAVAAGGTGARLAVERELRRRGWPVAAGPAEAAVLLVCGRPGPELAAAVDRVWTQLPRPKARAEVPAAPAAAAALDRAGDTVADLAAQRWPRTGRPPRPPELPMADRGPDRDGLALDRLHVALGPVLPDWPAGLVLRLVLQGDVVQHARVELPDGGDRPGPGYWDAPWRRAAAGEPVTCAEAARRLAARRLDSLGRLLAVAGWDGAALAGRRLRDDTLAGPAADRRPDPSGTDRLAARYRRFRRRVAGSWLLRWMTRDLGRVGPTGAAAFGFAPPPRGRGSDVADRTRWWLDHAVLAAGRLTDRRPLADLLAGGDLLSAPPPAGTGGGALSRLAELVVGTELATTRLVVASLDPDLDRPAGGDGDG